MLSFFVLVKIIFPPLFLSNVQLFHQEWQLVVKPRSQLRCQLRLCLTGINRTTRGCSTRFTVSGIWTAQSSMLLYLKWHLQHLWLGSCFFMWPYDSGRYYTECFGMKLLRKRDVPEEKYTNAFLGFGPEDTNFAVELTYSMFSDLLKFCLWHNCFTMLLMFAVAQFVWTR